MGQMRKRFRRRARGEGTISKRKDGLWEVRVTAGWTEDGRQRRRSEYAKSEAEAIEKMNKLRERQAAGLPIEPSKETVAGYLRRWLEQDIKSHDRPKTYTMYKGLVERHIAPRGIGGLKLSRLTPANLKALLSELEEAKASPRLMQMVRDLMHHALNDAVREGIVPRNVAEAVKRPRYSSPEMKVLDKEEMSRFLEAAKADPLSALYTLALHTGMRQGELFGLKWSDVDFERRQLQVQRQLIETKGQGSEPTFAEPKTKTAQRPIPLSPQAIEALQTHRKTTAVIGHGLVFTDTEGKPLRKSNVIRRSFAKVLERAKVKRIRFHDLRHTFATHFGHVLGARSLQAILGHANISLTLGLYGHVLPTHEAEAASKIGAYFEALPAPKAPVAKVIDLSKRR